MLALSWVCYFCGDCLSDNLCSISSSSGKSDPPPQHSPLVCVCVCVFACYCTRNYIHTHCSLDYTTKGGVVTNLYHGNAYRLAWLYLCMYMMREGIRLLGWCKTCITHLFQAAVTLTRTCSMQQNPKKMVHKLSILFPRLTQTASTINFSLV